MYDSTLVLYDMLGGREHCGQSPAEARHICCNRQHKRVLERFANINARCHYLDELEWVGMG